LTTNTALRELSLGGNKINNEGISLLGAFLDKNSTLFYLDISKNCFSDKGFTIFARHLASSLSLMYLDMRKSKDVSDEYSLVTLA